MDLAMEQDDLIGTMLGNYRILAPLGQGGMARVYKGYQENLDREVAIKVLPPWFAADRNFVERFNLEARLVARLTHPNIVTVHDADERNGHLYIVMQLVDGGTLKHRFDQLQEYGKTMELADATPIFTQLASALTYAHEQGVIHRDIKPVNVLMDRSGRAILSDFGIAKVLAGTKEHLTRPGAGVGTPEYMSPEQCLGAAVDGRSDIYALGVMLFEALTGRTPFLGDSYPALAHSHVYEMPPRPILINPMIPPAVERVILTALMKNPQLRYQKANDMARTLEQAQLQPGGPMAAQQPPGYPYGQVGELSFPGRRPPSSPDSREASLRNVYPQYGALPTGYSCRNGHPNKPETNYCTRCGVPLNQCLNCGSSNPAKNRFCTKCGQPLTL
jgi:serine/threonine protein kinase